MPPVQTQELLQAQAVQMKQMQQQLQRQQKELYRLQQSEKHQQEGPKQQLQDHSASLGKPEARPPQTHLTGAHSQKPSLVGVAAQVMTKTEIEKGSSGMAKPKGWDQCLKFARFVKSKDVTGVELVHVWKSTCEPAVQSGRATQRYQLMCDSLSGVVEPYSSQIDYDVESLCDSVLAVFHDVTAVDAKN